MVDDDLAFLRRRSTADYSVVSGNLAVYLLRREEGDISHFLTLTHWVSVQAIEAFAGEDITRAKYYAEDANFLLDFEPTVQHYEVADVARNDSRRGAPAHACVSPWWMHALMQ